MADHPPVALPPLPPRRFLTRTEAAAWAGVSVDVFDDEVRAGFWPAPRRRGKKLGLLTWDWKLLDAAADRDAGIAPDLTSIAEAGPMGDSPVEKAWRERVNGTFRK
jgi:hypothetical protein